MPTLRLVAIGLLTAAGSSAQDMPRENGYRGIWYYNQKSDDEYVYKYSGGLGTYCAKHQPFAVHCPQVEKTFFCYGGAKKDDRRALLHMVSFFDHRTGTVPRPVTLLDKQTDDAHDNPVMTVDGAGHLWVFSTSHGRSRPSFVHRSTAPFDITRFERVDATYLDDTGERRPLDNFSYFQAWHVDDLGFACFFTRYGAPAARTSMFMTSPDGVQWSRWQRLAAIEKGHYQISAVRGGRAAAACNHHPDPQGLNWRTNLYFMQTEDLGATWRSAAGTRLELPLKRPDNPALVHDYAAEGLLVYLKDLALDADGHPRILFVTSKGYASGPENDPRTWRLARWDGERWSIHSITTSDNNYDMGSLYDERDGQHRRWRVIAPTEPGPQRFNPGGEVAVWVSDDDGCTWRRERRLTQDSPFNHTYVRRPVNAHPDFYALWADGHGREPSDSRLHFATRDGRVFRLPQVMQEEHEKPLDVTPAR